MHHALRAVRMERHQRASHFGRRLPKLSSTVERGDSMSYLWQRENIGGNWFVVSPDGMTHIQVFHRDEPYRIERALCRILNSTSMHKFTDSHEEMDLRGVPR